ncbi:MAG: hypothetical protein NZ518_08990, partial [Dehalococcoidia bacterium]|nr:hypothetical protein [Dehalococcoidia bacterium]
LSWLTSSVSERVLDREMAHFSPAIAALEVENASMAGQVARDKVYRLNRERYHLAETGSSDAHFLPHIATSYTAFPGTTAADLRRAIETRTTCAVRAAPYSRVSVRLLLAQQRRSMIVLPARRVRQAMTRPRAEQAAR